MKNELAAVAVVVALVIGSAMGYSGIMGNATTVTNTVTSGASVTTIVTTALAAGEPCTGQLVWKVGMNSAGVPVLLMQPNTTAYVCETYQTWWKGNPNTNFTASMGETPPGSYQINPLFIGNEVCTPSKGCTPEISNAFRASVNPTSVQLNVYANYVSVVYTITALANSTGYYTNSVQYQGCHSMPLVVGHPASEVNDSVLGPSVPPSSCVFLNLIPASVAVSGMDVTYLNPQ